MKKYRLLKQEVYSYKNYSLVPIRFEDRFQIMKWRNEQIYHLRQNETLTSEKQDYYFNNIVNKLFDLEKPDQILFSFLENDVCIGYGGLVHINWNDSNAEISFVMDTQLEKKSFVKLWKIYLKIIQKIAFKALSFHKIYTYAFDIRPKVYLALEGSGFTKETVLKEHCFFDNKFIDVIIHSKINHN